MKRNDIFDLRNYTSFGVGGVIGFVTVRYFVKRFIPLSQQRLDENISVAAIGFASGVVQERARQGKYKNVDEAMSDFNFEQVIAFNEIRDRRGKHKRITSH